MNTDILKKSIDSVVSLSITEWQQVLDCFEPKTLKKNSYLLKEGQVCDFVALVNSGSLVYLKLSDAGKEITTDFAFTGDWVTDNRSRINDTPSFIHIKAIENSELLIVLNKNMEACYQQIPKLEKVGRMLMEQAYIKLAQQSIDLQTLSARQRYEKLLCEYPEIFQKVPLYHIANYLGIAPKSISRIRKG